MSFTRLDATDFVISADSVTAPAWSNSVTTLTSFFTASGTEEGQISGSYYVDAYNGDPSSATSAVQFSIAYGNSTGLGSTPLNSLVTGNSITTFVGNVIANSNNFISITGQTANVTVATLKFWDNIDTSTNTEVWTYITSNTNTETWTNIH